MHPFLPFFFLHSLSFLSVFTTLPLNTTPSSPLINRWKLLEVYQIDTAQHIVRQEELNYLPHREQQVFHCHEMGLEYQAMLFTADSLCYRLERRLDNEVKLYKPQRYVLMNDGKQLVLLSSTEIDEVLLLTSTMLILGRQKNRLEVYIPIGLNEEELRLSVDYIWHYYQAFSPTTLRRYEEGMNER